MTSTLIKKIERKISEKFSSIWAAFKFFDYDQNGLISYSEFVQGIENLGIHMFEDESRKLFEYLDKNKSNKLKY